jgi:hypothetical protein
MFNFFIKQKIQECKHEYFIEFNSHSAPQEMKSFGIFSTHFCLTCIHCGYGINHTESIPNCISSENPISAIKEHYKKRYFKEYMVSLILSTN